jgi:hypothetical protein
MYEYVHVAEMGCTAGVVLPARARDFSLLLSVQTGFLGPVQPHIQWKQGTIDRLCGLVVRVLGYRCRGSGFDSRALQKKSSGS